MKITEKNRKILKNLLLVVCIVSALLYGKQLLDNAGGTESYDDALKIAMSGEKKDSGTSQETTEPKPHTWIPAPIENPEEDPNLEVIASVDLDALRQVNPDVLGWIYIPDSRINYPIMANQDNDYYLKHTWEGKKNSVGSIFLEEMNDTDFADFNTILYGHNMTDGSMFADLSRYHTTWYRERHPYVYIALDSGIFRYEVFSAYKAPVEGFTYGMSFNQLETRVNFLMSAKQKAVEETNVDPTVTDRILTLSTCSGAGYSNRWVVHARLPMLLVE